MNTLTNKQILETAMKQSAVDLACKDTDFLEEKNVIVHSQKTPDCRKYLELPFGCNLVSYGGNLVASVAPEVEDIVASYIGKYSVEHCFETPNFHVLNDALEPLGMRICFMAEYFLPDLEYLTEPNVSAMREQVEKEGFTFRLLSGEDFAGLYTETWGNALCEKRKELDVLGVGVYEKERLIGLAACSADCETMWQIGVDVLPAYRRKGIACAMTGVLALEIMRRGKVPFYCAAWSNIKSVRNAIRAGFRPAWVEMTAKSAEFVEKMNR
ncbi:MAG: GNAT family N-acetyltransferase [Ruminococcus sp.]|nr:GNAT family N-acetyltransferase [Ruminococcus sp.]